MAWASSGSLVYDYIAGRRRDAGSGQHSVSTPVWGRCKESVRNPSSSEDWERHDTIHGGAPPSGVCIPSVIDDGAVPAGRYGSRHRPRLKMDRLGRCLWSVSGLRSQNPSSPTRRDFWRREPCGRRPRWVRCAWRTPGRWWPRTCGRCRIGWIARGDCWARSVFQQTRVFGSCRVRCLPVPSVCRRARSQHRQCGR